MSANEYKYWWLSFADPEKPAGKRFLGIAIVEARDFGSAVSAAHVWGCNPGGEVAGLGPYRAVGKKGQEFLEKKTHTLLTGTACDEVASKFLKHAKLLKEKVNGN